ncbi:MarR family winged helix-turn-helix transcriptional regulator [Ruania zhangjianzhongii]|uniref:MarR family winged helix-turn-helix transcriptional regulator n=1 Tax=Ruania zhangjianzhongii TaxID=2603206 RepID=UPI00143E0899|nr:MarR family transcriptional regulator [Ruania zhangjianzhongii]
MTARVHRDVAATLATEELSVDQWTVLDYLDDVGPCTMTALAGATGTNGATLTRIVDRLVSRALVYRNADSGDRRRVLVHVSERGREMTRDLRPRVRAAEQRATSELTEGERDELGRMLQRISTPPRTADDPGG